jgi:spore germination cell wall hydrolase CwlJ-like protein
MTDEDLLALNIAQEAGGEIIDGRAAIARIVKNRMARKFQSDGTMPGTVLKKDQFSWAYFEMIDGKYTRVCHTVEEAAARAEKLWAMTPTSVRTGCRAVAQQVMDGTYHGPDYDRLTDDAVNYLNPDIIPHLPAWASADKLVCRIGHHNFFRT